MNKTTESIPLTIPSAARMLMIALTVVHGCGAIAYFYLFAIKGTRSETVIFNAVLGLVALPFSLCLMTIPAILGRFPTWIVSLFGRPFIERLIREASMAWDMVSKKK